MVISRRGLSPSKHGKFWRILFGTYKVGDLVIYTSPVTKEKYLCEISIIYTKLKTKDIQRVRLVSIKGVSEGFKVDVPLEHVRHFYGS